MMADATTLREAVDRLIQDRLTARKAIDICDRDGYQVAGVVLRRAADGRCAIVNRSAVRWLSSAQMAQLLNPTVASVEDPMSRLIQVASAVASQTNPERAYRLHDKLLEALDAVDADRLQQQIGRDGGLGGRGRGC